MMYTSQELMICDIGYKTLGKFWSVKRIVLRNTHRAIPQTTGMRGLIDISRSARAD